MNLTRIRWTPAILFSDEEKGTLPQSLLRYLPRFRRQLTVSTSRPDAGAHRPEWTPQAVEIQFTRYAGSPEKSKWRISTLSRRVSGCSAYKTQPAR